MRPLNRGRTRLRLRRGRPWRGFRLNFRRFGPRRRRRLGRGLDRLRKRRRGRRKLDRSGGRRRLQLWGGRLLLRGRFCDRRRRLGLRKGRLLLGRRRCGRRRAFGRGKRGLLGDRRGVLRRRGRSRCNVLGRRGRRFCRRFLGRPWLLGRLRGGVCRRGFRLDVDDHFPGRFERPRRECEDRERGGVERNHDCDDRRTKPGRSWGRRLEDAAAERGVGHCAGAGCVEAEAGRRPLETMAMRVTPFAASSSMIATTSP